MSSRGLSVGHVFDQAGTHVATISQEVLLRLQRPSSTNSGSSVAPRGATVAPTFANQRCAVLLAPDDAEAGPDVVDGAHLVVDEAEGQEHLAHRVLGDVGRDLARLLRPRDPQASVDVEHVEQLRDPPLEVGPLGVERHDHVGRARPRACAR